MLTRKQLELLDFIKTRMDRDGVPPSFDEMKDALDLRSKSGIHRLITALEERGFIRRLAHRARALEIVKLPEAMEKQGFSPKVIKGDKVDLPRGAMPLEAVHAMELPVMGRIAAGVPIEAISHVSHHVAVPGSMLTGRGQHYALEVKGDSMIEAGINDGDIVVIREQGSAENGDIVVAGISGEEEATVKTFKQKGRTITLVPSNPRLEPMVFKDDEVVIYGKVVTVIRRF